MCGTKISAQQVMERPMTWKPLLQPMHFANSYNLPVKADDGATYYIGGKDRTAIIRTETDFGKATFILDDTAVQNRNAPVFMVGSTLQPFKLEGVTVLKKNQQMINATLPGPCLVTVTNSAVKQYHPVRAQSK